MRDHNSVTIENFNGLWARGGSTIGTDYSMDSCPLDHFSDVNNIEYIESGFQTRSGINILPPDGALDRYPNAIKVKNYPKIVSESLLVLDASGNIFDTGSPTPTVPILTVVGMLDFGLAIYSARAYISPNDLNAGLMNEFVYVYNGDGTPARRAGGTPPVDGDGIMTVANSATVGNVEAGIHIFAVVYETNTGFDTQIGPQTLHFVTAPGNRAVDLASIPVSPNSYVVNKRIVATKAINPTLFTGDTRGYQFFFVPGAVIPNATTTLTVNFFDIELLEDASHLLDLFTNIPAGLGLTVYNNRLVVWTLFGLQQNEILISYPGEPEAFDQVTGLLLLQHDARAITICQELRGSLYIFKYVKTFAVTDNGGTPDTWGTPLQLDQGLGSAQHGIATVLDTGGVSVDYLIIANFAGIFMFSGSYRFPELSFKIADFWSASEFGDFNKIEFYNDSIKKRLYLVMPNQAVLLMGDYQHGLDPKLIRWSKWTFHVRISSICLTQFNKLIIASNGLLP